MTAVKSESPLLGASQPQLSLNVPAFVTTGRPGKQILNADNFLRDFSEFFHRQPLAQILKSFDQIVCLGEGVDQIGLRLGSKLFNPKMIRVRVVGNSHKAVAGRPGTKVSEKTLLDSSPAHGSDLFYTFELSELVKHKVSQEQGTLTHFTEHAEVLRALYERPSLVLVGKNCPADMWERFKLVLAIDSHAVHLFSPALGR